MTLTKQIVTQRVPVIINFERLDYLVGLFNEYLEEHPDAELEIEHDYAYLEAYITYKAEETDKQFNNRVQSYKRQQEYQRKQYEELKKKFESS